VIPSLSLRPEGGGGGKREVFESRSDVFPLQGGKRRYRRADTFPSLFKKREGEEERHVHGGMFLLLTKGGKEKKRETSVAHRVVSDLSKRGKEEERGRDQDAGFWYRPSFFKRKRGGGGKCIP